MYSLLLFTILCIVWVPPPPLCWVLCCCGVVVVVRVVFGALKNAHRWPMGVRLGVRCLVWPFMYVPQFKCQAVRAGYDGGVLAHCLGVAWACVATFYRRRCLCPCVIELVSGVFNVSGIRV